MYEYIYIRLDFTLFIPRGKFVFTAAKYLKYIYIFTKKYIQSNKNKIAGRVTVN